MRPSRAVLANRADIGRLLAACASYVEGRVESVLLDAMRRVIGPADHYDATVQGANANASHFDQVYAAGDRVRRPRAPVIDRFSVDLQNVSLDRRRSMRTPSSWRPQVAS